MDGQHSHAEVTEPEWVHEFRCKLHDLRREILEEFRKITNKENRIMSQQSELNDYVNRLGTAVTSIKQEIADIQAANPSLDLSGLKSAVSDVEGLEPPVVTPPPVTPAP